MARQRQIAGRVTRRVRPWWQPLALSAATAAAVAALFNPLPAFASPAGVPGAPAVPDIPAVPDAGSHPIALGTLVMPGQQTSIPTTTTLSATPGVPASPAVAKVEKQRAEIAALGDRLIRLGQDRDLAKQQLATADANVAAAQTAVNTAQQEANSAAAASFRDAAALPPGELGTGLLDLDQLAQMQRGTTQTEASAARQLAIAQATLATAQAEQATTTQRAQELSSQYDALNAQLTAKQTALQTAEQQNAAALTAAAAQESAEDRALASLYLAGAPQGRGADARALAALTYALAQQGKPYQWSEEGPNSFDCSGLMWAAYHTTGAGDYPLARVAIDQYRQTDRNTVDRYSLLPGDLLFFSSTNSWTGIHHVAMYAGNGYMVEAPRTGLNVRVTPVRWTRLFAATRVYGSVDGTTPGPDLNAPPPSHGGGSNPAPSTPPTTTRPTPTPSTTPSSKPSTSPSTTPPTTTPTTTQPTTTQPTTTQPTTTPPTTTPTTTQPTTTPPTTTAPTSGSVDSTAPADSGSTSATAPSSSSTSSSGLTSSSDSASPSSSSSGS